MPILLWEIIKANSTLSMCLNLIVREGKKSRHPM